MNLCSIASGSSGNCIFVSSDSTSILIDAGISGKRTEQGLNEIGYTLKDLDGIFITHEHADHIKGLGVLARKLGVPLYMTDKTREAVMKTENIGKIPEELFRSVAPDRVTHIGDLEIHPFRIPHDAADPVGCRVQCGKQSLAVATDMGEFNASIIEHLRDLDVLLLEANHDVHMLEAGIYPYYLKQRILSSRGHLSNEDAGHLLCEVLHDDIRQILLGHLSRENNYPALAYETVCAEITMGDNPWKAKDFNIGIARRDMTGELISW